MIEKKLQEIISVALSDLFQINLSADAINIDQTKPDFTGDFTYVVFPILKQSKKSPEQTAQVIGEFVKNSSALIEDFNVIKGFLNLTISKTYWLNFVQENWGNNKFGWVEPNTGQTILVEYSSPNTNKPLHLGHIRNNLLGYSISEILKAAGNKVFTCNLINDRGIHICKSMYAWMQHGNAETPESSGIKGDHLVGKYYVVFDKLYKEQIAKLISEGNTQDEAEKNAPCMLAAQELLRKWEAGDKEVLEVWQTMNGWVYSGFDVTYKKLGVTFDKYYYESSTYLLGKDEVNAGLNQQVFYKRNDGSVWINLTEEGLDEKLVLRGDGTSVYITQDIGTAQLKFNDFGADRSIYVVGNEQDYHFKVLKQILIKLNKPYAQGVEHLSYGMVELPHGKMKSREGTVVDADDLMEAMEQTAKETTLALGKTDGFNENELTALYETIGLGALKYFILKVDPQKKMLFNPQESIDFHGNTGPFIQYTYARIRSILRNADKFEPATNEVNLNKFEHDLIVKCHQWPQILQNAANQLSPGIICNYTFDLAKSFNQFYQECSILRESDVAKRSLRLQLCTLTSVIIKNAFMLLGINVPERM